MENTQQPPGYYGSYTEPSYPVNRPPISAYRPPYTDGAHVPTQPATAPPQWASPRGYDGPPYRFGYDHPPPPLEAGFGGAHFPPPFGFDPTVPPPPFGYPPTGPFPGMEPPAPALFQQFRPDHQSTQYDPDARQNPPLPTQNENLNWNQGPPRRTEDEADLQRNQDQQWIRRFLQSRGKTSSSCQIQKRPQGVPDLQPRCVPELRRALYRAAQLVSQLAGTCESLRNGVQEDCTWTRSYSEALKLKKELQDSLTVLGDGENLAGWKTKLAQVAKRRSRRLRSRRLLQLEEKQRAERSAEKEAGIDKWRLQRIQQVEEKKKEQEVKLAADSVLCEVRKKQADVKRMQDVLRAVEKLRKLRKEAASRKGISTEAECDGAFTERVEELRDVMKRRTALYSAEEKALRVMLEGEQEEERRREQERKVKKERERQLQRRRRVHAVLFGEDLPADPLLQPFTQFYTLADRSLPALLQIRRDWDVFLVEADHSDGSRLPQTWILPDPPSDPAWAAILQPDDSDWMTA